MLEIIEKYSYSKDSLSGDVIPLVLPLLESNKYWTTGLLFVCSIIFVINCYKRLLTEEDKLFPIGKYLTQTIGTALLIKYFPVIFSGILMICNLIADKFYSTDQILNFTNTFIGLNVPTIKLMNLTALQVIATLVKICATIIFYVLGIWRFILLFLYLLFSPIVFALSLTPFYSSSKIKSYFVDLIQICSWPIIMSGLFLGLEAATISLKIGASVQYLDSLDSIVLMVIFLWGTLKVPFIASAIFGGNDFSQLTTATGLISAGIKSLSFGAASAALSPAKKIAGLAGQKASGGTSFLSEQVKTGVANKFKPKYGSYFGG